jgi:hypothetical protein
MVVLWLMKSTSRTGPGFSKRSFQRQDFLVHRSFCGPRTIIYLKHPHKPVNFAIRMITSAHAIFITITQWLQF